MARTPVKTKPVKTKPAKSKPAKSKPAKSKPSENRNYGDILYEVKDQVAWITINRPRVMNAFREQTLDEMIPDSSAWFAPGFL